MPCAPRPGAGVAPSAPAPAPRWPKTGNKLAPRAGLLVGYFTGSGVASGRQAIGFVFGPYSGKCGWQCRVALGRTCRLFLCHGAQLGRGACTGSSDSCHSAGRAQRQLAASSRAEPVGRPAGTAGGVLGDHTRGGYPYGSIVGTLSVSVGAPSGSQPSASPPPASQPAPDDDPADLAGAQAPSLSRWVSQTVAQDSGLMVAFVVSWLAGAPRAVAERWGRWAGSLSLAPPQEEGNQGGPSDCALNLLCLVASPRLSALHAAAAS